MSIHTLVPDDEVVWGDWSAADVVRNLFNWTALERRSARSIAKHLNGLCVPTSYTRLRRRMRNQKTRKCGTPGRILQLIKNSLYKGKPTFGKRPKDGTFPPQEFYGSCPPLVTEALWDAAQEALAANRLIPKNTKYVALLRSVIKCGLCGLTYCTCQGRGQSDGTDATGKLRSGAGRICAASRRT